MGNSTTWRRSWPTLGLLALWTTNLVSYTMVLERMMNCQQGGGEERRSSQSTLVNSKRLLHLLVNLAFHRVSAIRVWAHEHPRSLPCPASHVR